MSLSCVTATVLSLTGTILLPAQTAPPDAQTSIPVIKANTRAVIIDVFVTQGKDEPVPALNKQDFELLEDGKPIASQ